MILFKRKKASFKRQGDKETPERTVWSIQGLSDKRTELREHIKFSLKKVSKVKRGKIYRKSWKKYKAIMQKENIKTKATSFKRKYHYRFKK